MTKALLLIAHGSRREASNDEIRSLTARVSKADRKRFDTIGCAFLELAEPSIPDGIEAMIQNGAAHVTILPYFLAAGRHVIEDIPGQVETKRHEHPDVTIEIAPYFGTAEVIPELLLSILSGDTATAATS